MARRKKTMEILESIVDQVIKAPTTDKPKKTRKPRKKKIVESKKTVEPVKSKKTKPKTTKKLEQSPLMTIDTTSTPTPGESKPITTQPTTTYKMPVQIRRPGYKIVGL